MTALIDALLIRSMLLPAVMHLIGPANWYLPARLARALPQLDLEAGEAGVGEPCGPRQAGRGAEAVDSGRALGTH